MTDTPLAAVVDRIRKVALPRDAEQPDHLLLTEFTSNQDQTAFEMLVRRHGPMVLGVCRRVLGNAHDAEDAFQAVFLVLARKAGSIRKADSLASWLHGVAFRVASKVKRELTRRRQREGKAQRASHSTDSDVSWRELETILDEEISSLPAVYRGVFVHCCLEGMTRPEAARRLGLKEGTVASRLAEARKRLREALSRRGISLPATLGVVTLAEGQLVAARAAPLAQAAVRYALGEPVAMLSPNVVGLAERALETVVLSKIKWATCAVLALALLGVGTTLLNQSSAAGRERVETPQAEPEKNPPPPAEESEKVTFLGKVLDPDGKPVEKARITLWSPARKGEPANKPHAVTDAEGRYRFAVSREEALQSGPLFAQKEGFAADWRNLARKENEREVNFQLARDDVPITGRIVDLEGRPVEGATVRATSIQARMDGGNLDPLIEQWKQVERRPVPSPSRGLPTPPPMRSIHTEALGLDRPVKTDREGRFQLSGFGRERLVHLEMEGKGIAAMRIRVIMRGGQTTTSPVFSYAQVELVVIPGRTIEGTVRERGSKRPASGIRVSCGTVQATTDEQGRYRLEGLPKSPEKDYRVLTLGDLYFFSGRTVPDAPGVDAIKFDFEVDRAMGVTGTLYDSETRKPVAGRIQYIARADNPHLKDYPDFSSPGFMTATAFAREDGRFQVSAIPGKGWLCVTAMQETAYTQAVLKDWDGGLIPGVPSGFSPPRFHAVVPIDVDPDLKKPFTIDVPLRPGKSRQGILLDPDGKPIAGVLTAGLHPISVRDGNFIGAPPLRDNSFTVHGIDPNRDRTVVFYHPGKKLWHILHLRRAETGELTVKLAPMGTVRGRLVDGATKKPMPGIRVQVEISRRFTDYKELPYELIHDHGELLLHVVKTDEEGRFEVDGLVPGLKYNLVCSDGELRPGVTVYRHQEDVRVEPGRTTDLGAIQSKPTR